MTPERWARIKEVFHAALEQEPGQRAAFIATATAGDDATRAEVERLLDADRHSADFIEAPGNTTLLSGRVISHYEIGHLLGAGGMGRVYAARDVELGREVAVKVPSLDSQEAQARLRREAQHASRLSHPHICHIYEVGRADGQSFVAMELVHGRSLADVIRQAPLPIATATRYGVEIADALAHAHERGVTHRDLKSTNVMVTTRGVKVLDFGLARILDTHEIDALSQSQRSLTGEGLIAGTLPYMAPELLRGERGDQRADVWALGVLLYEMVSGRRPFAGATGFELSAAILHEPPPALPSAVPAPLVAIIRQCLAKRPAERYQQATDVRAALEDLKDKALHLPLRLPHISKRLAIGALLVGVLGLSVASRVLNSIGAFIQQRMAPLIADRVEPAIDGLAEKFSVAIGYSLLERGDFEQAVQQFEKGTRLEPEDANTWDSLAEGYLAIGRADQSLDAYSRALAISPTFDASILGRAYALAALGRYDEALSRDVPDTPLQAFLWSRVGRYRQSEQALSQARRELEQDKDADAMAGTVVTSAWLLFERRQYARALDEIRALESLSGTAEEPDRALLVLGGLIGGMAEIRLGNVQAAATRLESQMSRYDRHERVESNFVAALDAEIALAQREYDRAISSFNAAERRVWVTLGREALSVFTVNPPTRDGRARTEAARGNRSAAIEEYRRLTTPSPDRRSSAALEPRHVLALARLLAEAGDLSGARKEHERFLRLWASADADLPELHEARTAIAR